MYASPYKRKGLTVVRPLNDGYLLRDPLLNPYTFLHNGNYLAKKKAINRVLDAGLDPLSTEGHRVFTLLCLADYLDEEHRELFHPHIFGWYAPALANSCVWAERVTSLRNKVTYCIDNMDDAILRCALIALWSGGNGFF